MSPDIWTRCGGSSSLRPLESRPWRVVGWLASTLGAVGIVYSTSRATMACLAVGWFAVGALALREPRARGPRARRLVVATVLAGAAVGAVSGPPLFTERVTPYTATQQRAAGQSLAQNGGYRTEFWREAIAVARAHPLLGAGYGELANSSRGLVPSSWAVSPLAHDGLLQAAADGGLVLGLPVFAVLLLAAGGALRTVRASPRTGLVTAAAAVASLGLLAHGLVDFDWTYPALAAVLAAVAGLTVNGLRAGRSVPVAHGRGTTP